MTTAIGHAHAMVRSRPGLPAPNLQIIFAPFAFDLDHHGKLVLRTRPAVSQAVCVVRPKSRGTVELRSSDPFAAPVIRHQLLGDSDDLEQLAEGIELARGFVAQPALAGLVTEEVRPGPGLTGEALRNYCRLAAIPMYHPVGTCRMGTDADAVVDPDLKVRGVQGLWVADASVMPTLPAGNTNATAIMIGDKGAEHVLGALKAGAADAVSTP
jgi:choline dehydrogenase